MGPIASKLQSGTSGGHQTLICSTGGASIFLLFCYEFLCFRYFGLLQKYMSDCAETWWNCCAKSGVAWNFRFFMNFSIWILVYYFNAYLPIDYHASQWGLQC